MLRLLFICGCFGSLGLMAATEEPSPRPIRNYREAEAGDREAQLEVANYYANMYAVTGFKQHFEDALTWSRRSARQGNYSAMIMVAKLRMDGKSEDRNVQEASEWLHRLHDKSRVETGYAARLAVLYASGELGAVNQEKAYFFCLLQRMTGTTPYDMGTLFARLKRDLKPEQIARGEKEAYDWWEDRNKPAYPVGAVVSSAPGSNQKVNTEDGGPVAGSRKALATAERNRKESENRVKPLGKENKYTLRGPEDLEANKK